jgi:hypothetical protein
VIRRLLGKSSEAEPAQTGRLLTTVEVSASPASEAGPPPRTGPGTPAASLSEHDLDRLAVRVAERLLQSSMADTVTRIVSEVSERLVREEIDRIRAAAKADR